MCYFGNDFGWVLFLPIQAVFVAGEPHSNKFIQGHLMKIKLLVTADVTAVGSPDREERVILG